MLLAEARKQYHRQLCENILGPRTIAQGARKGETRKKHRKVQEKRREYTVFSNADDSSHISVRIAAGIAGRIGSGFCAELPAPQGLGSEFSRATAGFLETSFQMLRHLRPGEWSFSTSQGREILSRYDQYQHLAELLRLHEQYPELKAVLGGDYYITPDIVISRSAISDADFNRSEPVLSDETEARLSPVRATNKGSAPILHASVSCKWTMRSDRAQNTRTEALNLIRNRKGQVPRIVVVVAEPLPSRIASIALGTGDVDCTYHFALDELRQAVVEIAEEEGSDYLLQELDDMINGRRLRDISDLPLDLIS